MFYRLSDQIALRSWVRVEGAYYQKNIPTALPLTRREFDTLRLCDGEHDLEPDATLASLAESHPFVLKVNCLFVFCLYRCTYGAGICLRQRLRG